MLAVAAEAVRRYPTDPETWMAYGETLIHYGNSTETTELDALRAFMRSIGLDPEYGPAYYHVVQAGPRNFSPDTVRRYATKMLSLRPDEETSAMLRTLLVLLSPGGTDPDTVRSIVEREPAKALGQVGLGFIGSPDTLETGLAFLHGWMAKTGSNTVLQVVVSIAERQYGHLRKSRELLQGLKVPTYADHPFAFNGAEFGLLHSEIPPSFLTAYEHSLHGPFRPDSVPLARAMLSLWARDGDTTRLRRYERIVDSLAHLPESSASVRREPPLARAYLALGRRDTSQALAQLGALPDSLYGDAFLRLTRADLLAAAGRDAEAAAQLEHPFIISLPLGLDGLRMMQRGRVAERLGRREVALESYQWVADMWRRADPELQPYVTEARAALARLTAERQ
jgi:hypothetical protein